MKTIRKSMKVNIKYVSILFMALFLVGIPSISRRVTIEGTEVEAAIVIACDLTNEPFTNIDESGNPSGLYIDMWRLWGEKTGRSIDFFMTDWGGSISAVETGRADFHSGLYYSEEMAKNMVFSQSFFEDQIRLFYNPSYSTFHLMSDLKGRKVGVVKDSYSEEVLKSNYPNIDAVPFVGNQSMLEAIDNGLIDALFKDELTVRFHLMEKERHSAYAALKEPKIKTQFHAGVLKDNKEMLKLINEGLDQISMSEWDVLINKWVKPIEASAAIMEGKFELTTEEKEWLKKHPKIHMGADANWAPFSFLDTDGAYEGMASDYVELLNKILPIDLKPDEMLSWSELLGKAKRKEIDILANASKTKEREEYLNFTKPYASFPMVIVMQESAPFIRGLEDMNNMEIAIVKTSASQEFLEKDYPEYQYVLVDDIEDGLKALSKGRVDALVDNVATVTHATKKLGITNVKIAASTPYEFELTFGVRKDWPELVGILEKGLALISPNEREAIESYWLGLRYKRQTDWNLIIQIITAASLLLGIIFWWNRRLSREIHEKERAELALQIAKEEAESARAEADAANQTRGEFLANMSHEIRTPMNAVIGLDQLLMKTELDSKQRDYASKIGFAAQNLLGIINDILDFSKIEAGKLEVENTEFDLDHVLEHLSDIASVKAAEKHLEVIIKKDKHVPTMIYGDSLRLGQVLLNLTNNAIKFTPEGEIIISIGVLESKGDRAILSFSVEDTGIGMTEEQVNKLFQPFTQAEASITRKYGGTGLGLTISKTLIEMMNGTIGVESEHGKGSVFSFTLPVRIHAGDKMEYRARINRMKGMKVLVVDDNENARIILREYLEALSFKVTTVTSGEEAIGSIMMVNKTKSPYQLVMTDWKMGEMNGIDLCKLILSTDSIKFKPKMILVTAYGIEEAMKGAERLKLDGILQKPVCPSALLSAIRSSFKLEEPEFKSEEVPKEIVEDRRAKLRGKRILLVEDNSINQQIAREFLESEGIVVQIAGDGKQAVEMLREKPGESDLVLMDVQMPVMDGYEATREIRTQLELINLPIIAMTADAMKGVEKDCLDAGMNDYVTKPFVLEPFLEKLMNWMLGDNTRSQPPEAAVEDENSET